MPDRPQKPDDLLAAYEMGLLDAADRFGRNELFPLAEKMDNIEQLEQNVKWASEFVPYSPEKMAELEKRTLPIVRQALYFRRWDMGSI